MTSRIEPGVLCLVIRARPEFESMIGTAVTAEKLIPLPFKCGYCKTDMFRMLANSDVLTCDCCLLPLLPDQGLLENEKTKELVK